MSKRLTGNLNSKFIEAASKLHPQGKGKKKSSFAKRLEELQKQAEQMQREQNRRK